MDPLETNEFVMEDKEAQLEMALIEEYLQVRGCTMGNLRRLPKQEAKRLMTEATTYASNELEEMKDTAQLAHELHGTADGKERTPVRLTRCVA